MRDVLALAGVVMLALAVVGGIVVRGGDSTVLTSAPEAVAETFVRDLVAGRYDLAMGYVDRMSRVSLTTVRLSGESLLRTMPGVVPNDVEGERSTIVAASASAVVTVNAPGERIELRVELVRRPEGVWRVTDWHPRHPIAGAR